MGKWVEYKHPNPAIDGIVAQPFVMDAEGMLEVPKGPGLGIALDMEAVAALGKS